MRILGTLGVLSVLGVRRGMVWCGAVWGGVVGVAWRDEVCDVVRCSAVWCGVVWGEVQCGVV